MIFTADAPVWYGRAVSVSFDDGALTCDPTTLEVTISVEPGETVEPGTPGPEQTIRELAQLFATLACMMADLYAD